MTPLIRAPEGLQPSRTTCCSAHTMTSSETLGSSDPTYDFAVRFNLGREVPQFTLPVCFLRAVFRTPADRTTALGCSFIARCGLPHLCSGSASTSPRVPVPAWLCNEAAKFTLWYGPEVLLALHRPGRLRSSFHLLSRLTKASNITTRVNQPIPATGLAPARQAALWAANRGHRGRGERRSAFLSDLCDLCGRSFLRGKRKS